MGLVLNGSAGTVTGLAEGGLEDAKILPADLKSTSGTAGTGTFYRGDGAWVEAGGGKILGIATGSFPETQRAVTSTSWVDSGIEVTYTPVASDSTALIHVKTEALGNSGNYMYLAIRQDDATLGGGSSDTEFMGTSQGNSYTWMNCSFTAHVTPTWTAGTATTFNLYCARHSTSQTLYLGWGDSGTFGHSADWMTIQEVAA